MKLSKSYPFFPVDKKILNKISILIIGIISSLLMLLSIILIALQFILDKELIREMISKQINESTNFIITYENVETILFPLPGIQIKNISVANSEYPIARINEITIYWNVYALLVKEFKLSSISIDSGELTILRSEDGTFPAFINTKKEKEKVEKISSETEKTPDGILSLLPNEILIENVKVIYIDQRWFRADQIRIESFKVKLDAADRESNVNLSMLMNGSKIEIVVDTRFLENNWNLENISTELQLTLHDFKLNPYSDILSIFPNAEFQKTSIDVLLNIHKEKENSFSLNVHSLSLKGLESKSKKSIQEISIVTNLKFNQVDQSLSVSHFEYQLKDKAKLNLTSKISWKNNLELTTKVDSDNLDIDSTLAWITLFSKYDKTKSYILKDLETKKKENTLSIIPQTSNTVHNLNNTNESNEKLQRENLTNKQLPPSIVASLNLNKIQVANHYIHKLSGKIIGNSSQVTLSDVDLLLYEGKVSVNGVFRPKDKGQNLNLTATLSGIDTKKLLTRITKDSLLTGKMDASIQLSSRIAEKDSFANSLNVKSNFKIKNGELLGYANFIRPVAELGKLVSFYEGNQGKSTSFKTIQGSVSYRNKVVTLNDFNMEGAGINAVGSGIYTINGKVNMRFEASFPGIAGKAFKIPILYKGVLGKNIAFIDPVWMASVYVGSIIFAGPAGAFIGGLAGSASSEAVQKATDVVVDSYDSAKNFLFGKDKKK